MKPRIVAVHHWYRNGVPLTTVWMRQRGRRQLYATTTCHKIEDGRYAGHSTESIPVSVVGEWNGEGAMCEGWEVSL